MLTHTSPRRFAPRQILAALQEQRVHVIAPELLKDEPYEGHDPANYPFVLFPVTVSQRWCIADGWRIDAKGQVFPGHVVPVPVRMSDVSCIDMVQEEVARPLLDFAHDGFASPETQLVAQTLCSDARAWDALLASADLNSDNWNRLAAAALKEYAKSNRRALGFMRVDLSMVDFEEIATQFEPECSPVSKPSTRQPRPALAAATKTPDVEVELEAEADGRKIAQDVLDVLRLATADDSHIYLQGQMPKTLYRKVDAVLTAMGGKWIGGSRRAHRFQEPIAHDLLQAACRTGRYTDPRDHGFFPTPMPLVMRMLDLAGIGQGMQVLEPQAGDGRLALAAAARCGGTHYVTVCELLDTNLRKLSELGFAGVWSGDFLRVPPERRFHAAVLNPPFSGHQDAEHIVHASRFVVPSGTVTAIASRSWMHQANNKKAAAFREFIAKVKATVEEIPSGAFRESGTEVATTLIHFKV